MNPSGLLMRSAVIDRRYKNRSQSAVISMSTLLRLLSTVDTGRAGRQKNPGRRGKKVAYFLASDFVARQSKTAEGILFPRASSEAKK
jgi:hypothetical protein